jgi:hypothetical protein
MRVFSAFSSGWIEQRVACDTRCVARDTMLQHSGTTCSSMKNPVSSRTTKPDGAPRPRHVILRSPNLLAAQTWVVKRGGMVSGSRLRRAFTMPNAGRPSSFCPTFAPERALQVQRSCRARTWGTVVSRGRGRRIHHETHSTDRASAPMCYPSPHATWTETLSGIGADSFHHL